MKLQFKELLIYFVSILSLILFLYLAINYLIKAPPKIINFIDSDINQDFEIEITNNIENINNYLNILNRDDISELIELYKNNCWKMRDRVRFLQNNIEFEGILDDITDTFEILIKVNGELKKFNSGELSFSY